MWCAFLKLMVYWIFAMMASQRGCFKRQIRGVIFLEPCYCKLLVPGPAARILLGNLLQLQHLLTHLRPKILLHQNLHFLTRSLGNCVHIQVWRPLVWNSHYRIVKCSYLSKLRVQHFLNWLSISLTFCTIQYIVTKFSINFWVLWAHFDSTLGPGIIWNTSSQSFLTFSLQLHFPKYLLWAARRDTMNRNLDVGKEMGQLNPLLPWTGMFCLPHLCSGLHYFLSTALP